MANFSLKGEAVRVLLFLAFFLMFVEARIYTVTPESVHTIKKICRKASGGDILYLRGGVYTHAFPTIRCSGLPNNKFLITPYPGEKVTIRVPWVIEANYLQISGLNFKGDSEAIDYDQVIDQWWNPSRAIRTTGMMIRGHHILLENNAIGYFPASGVKITGKSDYLTIRHNIIYNNAWWSTGGTGGLIVKNIHQFDESKAQKVVIEENLLFGNESRIISHVFKKGFSKMTIDEGESFLIQQKDDPRKKGAKKGHYLGAYLVRKNLILYNGKGCSLNKAERIEMVDNTLYCNGTTAQSPNAGGIRGNHTHHDIFLNNAIGCCGEKRAISVIGRDNRFEGNVAQSSNQPPMKGLRLVEKLFRDPEHLDFRNPGCGDRANRLLAAFQEMLQRYGITVRATGYRVDVPKQISNIVARIPRTSETVVEREKDRILIRNIDNRGIRGLPRDFVLKLR